MKIKNLMAVFLLGLSLAACKPEASAETSSSAFPPELLLNGQPIDPLCFEKSNSMESGMGDIALQNCADGFVVKEYFSKGPYDRGAVFTYEGDEDFAGMGTPYMQYRYAGIDENMTIIPAKEADGRFPVLLNWSGGGTGHFSNLLWLKREGNVLKPLQGVTGGDRCNGGVVEALMNKDGQLQYAVNITPYDMVMLGGDAERPFMQSVKAFEDLDACAACCTGTAHFTGDEFTGVKLQDGLKDYLSGRDYADPVPPEQEKQACFDRLLVLQAESGQMEFTPDNWETFIREVEHVCLGRVEGE